jgi:hypothetical protein
MPESTTGDRAKRGVTLTGEAAAALRNTLLEPAKKGLLARKAGPVTGDRYLIVLDETQQKALRDGTQRFAKPGKGDASLRLKDVKTGKSMPEARLEKVGDSAKAAAPSVTKVLGPVAWEAMAMATQQHYLVEISDKLEGIASSIDELLERDDDDKRGTLVHVESTVARSRERLEVHGSLSASRIEELRHGARDASRVWHQLRERFRRHLTGYGEGDTTREQVERSWEILMHATRVMTAASGLLTSLPFETVEELENAQFEERERVLGVIGDLQELAYEFAAWHIEFRQQAFKWDTYGSRNPLVRHYRQARGYPAAHRPDNEMLTGAVARQAAQLALPAAPPSAILIHTHAGGEVSLVVEAAATTAA